MSVGVQVLFQMTASVEEAVEAMQRLLSIRFQRIDDDDLVRFEFRGPGFVVVMYGDADFEGALDGHDLTKYPFVIGCRATQPEIDYDAAESIRIGLSTFIFRKVARAGHRALLVYDLQRVIEASP